MTTERRARAAELRAFGKLVAASELFLLRLTHQTAELDVDALPEDASEELHFDCGPMWKHEVNEEDRLIFTSMRYTFELTAGERTAPMVRIVADYDAFYEVSSKLAPPWNGVETFVQFMPINVVWPAFRDLVQTTLLRMNLPVAPLPVAPIIGTAGVPPEDVDDPDEPHD